MLRRNRFLQAIVYLVSTVFLMTAMTSQASSPLWRLTTEHDPLYNSQTQILESEAIGKRHIYEVSFSCYGPRSPNQGLKISVAAFDSRNKGTEFPFDYYTDDETRLFIDTTLRIGDMQPSQARWSKDGYVNQASIEIFKNANFVPIFYSEYRPIDASTLYEIISRAFERNEQLVVSGFFPDDPLVITLGNKSEDSAWHQFRAACPSFTKKSAPPPPPNSQPKHAQDRTATAVATSNDTHPNKEDVPRTHSTEQKNTKSIDALESAYSEAEKSAEKSWPDSKKLKSLDRKSVQWRKNNCTDQGCKARWYKNRIQLLRNGGDSESPSFDCKLATSLPEMLICNNSQLASSDRKLSHLYERAKAKTDNTKPFQRQTVNEWEWREKHCSTVNCLSTWFSIRTDQLNSIVKGTPEWSTAGKNQALSANGKTIAWIDRHYGDSGDPEIPYEIDSIFAANPTDPQSIPKLLLRTDPDAGIEDGGYESFDKLVYAQDSRTLYVDATPTAANYTKILSLNPKTGKSDDIQTGQLLGVITDGRYKGSLLVSKHKYKNGGGSFDPVEVVSGAGKTQLTVPGTATSSNTGISQTRTWLENHHWKAVWN